MKKEELETKTIKEINSILLDVGYYEDCVYPIEELNQIYTSALDLALNISKESNLLNSKYFRKDAYGHFIGFATETDAKKYVIEIANGLL